MSKSTFISDLSARIRDAERIIADQNENLVALRHLLQKEIGEETPAAVAPPAVQAPHAHAGVVTGGAGAKGPRNRSANGL